MQFSKMAERGNFRIMIDITGDLTERYGYVNRSLRDADLDTFVDTQQTGSNHSTKLIFSKLPKDPNIFFIWRQRT